MMDEQDSVAPNTTTRPHFFSLDEQQLQAHLLSWGMPRFRAKQLLQWVYEKGVADPNQMSNLSKADRQTLLDRMQFNSLSILQEQLATDGTRKLLLGLEGNEGNRRLSTECVMIPSTNDKGRSRRTACISSQVGCPVGCRFCASGLGGLDQNLTCGQIVEQVWWLNRLLAANSVDAANPDRITHIVFMGMGEPLSNYKNVLAAVRTLNSPWAMNLSARRITISTVGLPAQIRRLAEEDLPVTLAISLHAPFDKLRQELIPWAQYTSIDQILDAGRYYFQQTGREITLEYILLREVNDRTEHAEALARIARTLRSNVNLIRYNEVRTLPFNRPDSDDVHQFQQILRDEGVNVHIRASRGRDIAAACGQLRHETAGV